MRAKKSGFLRDESGATSIEYAMLASMISLAAIPAAGTLGTRLTGTFEKVALAFEAAAPTTPSAPGGGGGGGSSSGGTGGGGGGGPAPAGAAPAI